MQGTTPNYRRLDSDRIVETVQTLRRRIEGRFPGSGLSNVVAEVLRVSEETVGRIRWIQKPHLPLRCAALVLSLAIIALVLLMLVLKAIHELRALAHIVDMHQLTKDPESYFAPRGKTAPPAKRAMTSFELNRYLDYCSELLALISKIAALYVQDFQDPVLLDAVDDVEDLTAGFSRKIWQKITILENLGRSLRA